MSDYITIQRTTKNGQPSFSRVFDNTVTELCLDEITALLATLNHIPHDSRMVSTFNYMQRINKLTLCVCGFYIADYNEVLLIKKARPRWQYDFLNGVGGKIEDFETPIDAMVREFKEETGCHVPGWIPLVTLYRKDKNCLVYFFYQSGTHLTAHNSDEDEPIMWIPVNQIGNHNVLPNLKWLIPLAMDRLQTPVMNEERFV